MPSFFRSASQQRQYARRLWLKQAGALAGVSALPLWVPNGYAQTTLNALPLLALITGNTKYTEAPITANPNRIPAIITISLFILTSYIYLIDL